MGNKSAQINRGLFPNIIESEPTICYYCFGDDMDRDTFKLIHSELIMQVQTIEYDLKLIYAAMKEGDFEENFAEIENANMGKIIKELRELDYSDGHPDLSEKDYRLLNEIREIRNYWAHQCYLDFVYIQDDDLREERFQEIAERLHYDENRTWALHEKMQALRNKKIQEYRD